MVFRQEYPRPNFIREEWKNLNGKWNFEFDDENIGHSCRWYEKDKEFSKNINVPFVFQSKLSGIEDPSFHDYLWYKRKFIVPISWRGKRIHLNFGAVDYYCKVFINEKMVITHEGGQTGFSVDITDYLNWNEEDITVYVYDPSEDETIPRGKQYWEEKPDSIWYTRSSGIWQTVWLEPVDKVYIDSVSFTPFIDEGSVKIETNISELEEDLKLKTIIKFKNEIIYEDIVDVLDCHINRMIDIFNMHIFRGPFHNDGWCWTPENPNLFDVTLVLYKEDKKLDEISSYFGMRKIHIENGMVYLNNKPYYQKLVLDQGYWKEGLITAPEDEDFIKDIKYAKAMGFNGCRKHQKVEDPRFLYWADKIGFIVWGEMASCIEYNNNAVERITKEWIEVIKRDYNHPSIVTWVPLNESWGVPNMEDDVKQQNHSLALYYMIKSLDDTRLVISNDGWELTETDICAIHNYCHGEGNEIEKYNYYKRSLEDKESILKSKPANRNIYVKGYENKGEPIMLTEFGGIAYDVENTSSGWGYTSVKNEEDFLEDYERIIDAIYNSKVLHGFCYTQLTDVEQEINGLLTYDREPKVSFEKIKEINAKWHNNIVEDF